MSSRSIRFGTVHEESNDKGPFKIGKVMADGKVMDVEFMDLTGSEGSPLKNSRVVVFTPDGDDGKAVAMVFGPPVKDRTDGQKPGEVTFKNHKTGSKTQMAHDGSINTESSKDVTTKAKGSVTTHADGDVVIKSDGKVYIN
jgi:hypothetical protein